MTVSSESPATPNHAQQHTQIRDSASQAFPVAPNHAENPLVMAAGFLAEVIVPFAAAMLFAAFVRGQAGVVLGVTVVLPVSVLMWFGRHL